MDPRTKNTLQRVHPRKSVDGGHVVLGSDSLSKQLLVEKAWKVQRQRGLIHNSVAQHDSQEEEHIHRGLADSRGVWHELKMKHSRGGSAFEEGGLCSRGEGGEGVNIHNTAHIQQHTNLSLGASNTVHRVRSGDKQ